VGPRRVMADTESFTARRSHAGRNQISPPSVHRWRVSFGADGSLLAFGSRVVALVDLAKVDSLDPEEYERHARTAEALNVHVSHSTRPEPVLTDRLRKYKEVFICTTVSFSRVYSRNLIMRTHRRLGATAWTRHSTPSKSSTCGN